MTAVASFLIVLLLSLIVARVVTVALTLTGLSPEVARFQARSALSGTGFTTRESESIVGHPVRRRIVMVLMLARNAGLTGAIASLVLSFTGSPTTQEALTRLGVIAAGLAGLWIIARSRAADRMMSRIIRRLLNRYTEIGASDLVNLLDISGDFTIQELALDEDDWPVGKTLADTELHEEGILVLGIRRESGNYLGAPTPDTEFQTGDQVVLYGRSKRIRELRKRGLGAKGDTRHEQARREQEQVEEIERREDLGRSSAD